MNSKPYPGALVIDESVSEVMLIISMEHESNEELKLTAVGKPPVPSGVYLQRFIGARWYYFTDESLDRTRFLWHTSIVEGKEHER